MYRALTLLLLPLLDTKVHLFVKIYKIKIKNNFGYKVTKFCKYFYLLSFTVLKYSFNYDNIYQNTLNC